MSLSQILSDWKFTLTEAEMVTKSSLELLERRIRERYHLVPLGNISNLKDDRLMDEWVEQMKEYHNI